MPSHAGGLSGTQVVVGGQGATKHWTFSASQCMPSAQRTVAQGSSYFGGGTHVHVTQPSSSSA
jgi:hypothetical protein